MRFCIAESFSSALQKLNSQEQKQVKITVFDLQQSPSAPGLKFHRIDASKDPSFWSVRVNRDVRLVIHKTEASFLVCYVDHHDEAYKWAERRRIETHPKTGAAQIVEVRELVEEIRIKKHVHDVAEQLPLFANMKEDDLLSYGVPQDWLADVQAVRDEDTLLHLAEHLPQEAGEALIDLAVGQRPAPQMQSGHDPLSHPDAQRRFRVMEDVEELARALDYPWDKWSVFLHPSQRKVVDKQYNGPARVSGSAGTGKTVVALHRVANLLRDHEEAKILLTTFSDPLAATLQRKLRILVGEEEEKKLVPRYRVMPFEEVGKQMYVHATGREAHAAKPDLLKAILESSAKDNNISQFSPQFILSEWATVIDAWQLDTLEDYANVTRLGRKYRMSAKQREAIWPVFATAKEKLKRSGYETWPGIYRAVADHFEKQEHKPFTHAVVDEAQDLGVCELRMIASLVPKTEDSLFFAGDLGQRIFQEPFSWKELGVDIQGRSHTLKVNYRTSHQIRRAADKLLPTLISDVDGNKEDRTGTVSVFNGPEPEVRTFDDRDGEIGAVTGWIRKVISEGVDPGEVGVFVRTNNLLDQARKVVREAGESVMELSARVEEANGRISVGNMHLAKGLEFKAVVVMACDDDILPLQERMDEAADEIEQREVFDTERHLFYVACTRARERLLVTGVKPASEYFEDILVRSE